jgi:hypothetical protein
MYNVFRIQISADIRYPDIRSVILCIVKPNVIYKAEINFIVKPLRNFKYLFVALKYNLNG